MSEKTLLYISRVSGSMSVLGSLGAIYIIVSDYKKKMAHTKNRLVFLMSITDVFLSTAIIVGASAFPRESGIFGAVGNETTCAIQGFIAVLGLALPMYNASLSMFYAMTICKRMNPKAFAEKFEPWVHLLCIGIPLIYSTVSVSLNMMAPIAFICFSRGGMPTRILFPVILVSCIVICVASMVMISRTVLKRTKKMNKYRGSKSRERASIVLPSSENYKETIKTNNRRVSFSGDSKLAINVITGESEIETNPRENNKNKKSNTIRSRMDADTSDTVIQAILFASALILTYAFPIISSVGFTKGNADEMGPLVLNILSAIFFPLSGFWNFSFFILPSVTYLMRVDKEISFFFAVWQVLFRSPSLDHRASISNRRSSALPLRNSISGGRSSDVWSRRNINFDTTSLSTNKERDYLGNVEIPSADAGELMEESSEENSAFDASTNDSIEEEKAEITAEDYSMFQYSVADTKLPPQDVQANLFQKLEESTSEVVATEGADEESVT